MGRVALQGIVKRYKPDLPATIGRAGGVDLVIEDGEFFILLGPSGCGKSTLLRMIAGLETITEGALTIDGRRVNDVAPKDRDIAMVFQSYALYPHLTVRDNLGFGLRMRGTPPDELARRVAAVAEPLGLGPLLERLPKELSGGQRQRVALGRAIVREPKVFLLDEPLSNLDAKLRGSMRVELKRLHQRLRATMIYVTHDQVEAMTLGDRVAVVHEGAIQQTGAPLEVYDRPANRFVATFLGSPPMNLLRGRIEPAAASDTGGEVLAAAGGVRVPLPARLRGVGAEVGGGEVELGVRPEDLRVAADGPLRGPVVVVEALGAETTLVVDTPAGPVTARVAPGHDPRVGEQVALAPDPDRVHLFDAATGARRGPPPPERSGPRGGDGALPPGLANAPAPAAGPGDGAGEAAA